MVVSSTELQNNFGKYVDLAENNEIIITRNGSPIARLLGMNKTVSFLSDSLVGIIQTGIEEDEMKSERLSKQ